MADPVQQPTEEEMLAEMLRWRNLPAGERRRELLAVPDPEKVRRYDAMVVATFSHVDGCDLLRQLHPRRSIDIKRRVDGVETWFEGDWLSDVMRARDHGL